MASRNALCPCGSNKKYKKCCFKKDQSKRHQDRATEEVDIRADSEKPVYKLWEAVSVAMARRDYRAIYQVIHPELREQISSDVDDFIAKVRSGKIKAPCEPPFELKRIVLPEEDAFILLWSKSTEVYNFESWHCVKGEKHWAIKKYVRSSMPVSDDFKVPDPRSFLSDTSTE